MLSGKAAGFRIVFFRKVSFPDHVEGGLGGELPDRSRVGNSSGDCKPQTTHQGLEPGWELQRRGGRQRVPRVRRERPAGGLWA